MRRGPYVVTAYDEQGNSVGEWAEFACLSDARNEANHRVTVLGASEATIETLNPDEVGPDYEPERFFPK